MNQRRIMHPNIGQQIQQHQQDTRFDRRDDRWKDETDLGRSQKEILNPTIDDQVGNYDQTRGLDPDTKWGIPKPPASVLSYLNTQKHRDDDYDNRPVEPKFLGILPQKKDDGWFNPATGKWED